MEIRLLEDKYLKLAHLVIAGGREALLTKEQAHEFVEECRQSGVVICGMSFFVVGDRSILKLSPVGLPTSMSGDKYILEITSADFGEILVKPDASLNTTWAAKEIIKNGLPEGASYVSFTIRTVTN